MTRLGFVIDKKSCIACHACAVACKVENNLPDGNWWNRILTEGGDNMDAPEGTYPNLSLGNIAVACQHCKNPACVKVCPVGATYKDPETGVVRQDYDKCIGCRMCMAACPYTGVRSFNWTSRSMPSGRPWATPTCRHTRSMWWRSARCAGTAWRKTWLLPALRCVLLAFVSSATWTIRTRRCRSSFATANTCSCLQRKAPSLPCITSSRRKGDYHV